MSRQTDGQGRRQPTALRGLWLGGTSRLPKAHGDRASDPKVARGHREKKRRQESLRATDSDFQVRHQSKLRQAPKRVAARCFQLLSGHATIAPFLKDKWGWTDREICWWVIREGKKGSISLKSALHGPRKYGSCGKQLGKPRGGVRMSGEALSRSGKGSASGSGRPGQGQATLRYGTCCQMTGTRRRFWPFWGRHE